VGNDYELFKTKVLSLTGINLSCYKEKQMKRRIDALISKYKVTDYQSFVDILKKDRIIFEEFVSYLTINVSEFFRNKEQWDYMEKEVLPELIQNFGKNLRIWSAACSTGDEPYSLVMTLSKYIPLNQITIYATDLDKQILEKAKNGIYGEKSIAGVPQDLKQKYFEKIGSAYQIKKEIKDRVIFEEQNLLSNEYPNNFHLIVCRNVLIYFTEDAKNEVFAKFAQSLKKGGVLFIGSTEQIVDYKNLDFERKNSFFYQKVQ